MAKETEIKLPVRDIKAFERKVKKLGGKRVRAGTGRVHELNVIFDTPDGGLAKHGQLLRVRTETVHPPGKKQMASRVVLTFKQPAVRGIDDQGSRFKIREETEVEIIEAEPLRKIFEGLGLRGWFSYEKYRTTWKLGAAQRWAGRHRGAAGSMAWRRTGTGTRSWCAGRARVRAAARRARPRGARARTGAVAHRAWRWPARGQRPPGSCTPRGKCGAP